MSQSPKVSVIIPVYNAEPYLTEMLQSLSAQTYKNIEVFFVDDGSTDRSVKIIRQYTVDHSEARLLQQEHAFAGVARNHGMRYAQGEYLLFLDADDFFRAEMIEKAVARAEETNADICVFQAEMIDQKTGQKRLMPWVCKTNLFPSETETFSRHTDSKNIFQFTSPAPWNKLFRRSFIEANNLTFQNTQSSNDVAFVMTALALADRITICNTVLLTYRSNNATSLQGSKHTNPLSFYEARRELRKRLIERHVFDEVELSYVNSALTACIYHLKTMKTQESYERAFDFLKNKGFSELDLLRWPEESIYQDPQNHPFENREAIMELSAFEYARRYHPAIYHSPAVSVIIPVYNTEAYLRECLDSVVNQTLQDIEIICVDDASQDASAAILAEYSERDDRVHPIYYSSNKSASQARKDGVLLAAGKYVMFVDSDDTLELTACEELSKEMDQRNVDMLQFGTFVDAEPYVAPETIAYFTKFAEPYPKTLRGAEVFKGCFRDQKFRFNLWNKIYKTTLCKKAFAEVEDGNYPKAQDLYAFFIVAWEAKSYDGLKTKYYHYHYGRGITGGGRQISLDVLRRFCSQYTVAQRCKEFLLSHDGWYENKTTWERINRHLASECISQWFNTFPASNGGEGFDLLADTWGPEIICDLIKVNYARQINQVISKAYGSHYPVEELLRLDHLVDSNDRLVPDGYQQVVPIIFATNDAYAPFAGVAIESIIEHASPENYYRIYILHAGLSNNHITSLEALKAKQLSIQCVNIDLLVQSKEARLHERSHYAKEMYYRFTISELFYFYPCVVYLDCDLVVKCDIAEIIPPDLGDHLVAAVRNVVTSADFDRLASSFGLDGRKYFNSAVLVINIQRWRTEQISEKCFDLLRTIPREKLAFPDQDILNIVCRDRILFLDYIWNFYWNMIYGVQDFVDLCAPVVEQVGEDYRVLHFASNIKPWSSPELPLSQLFWKYARKSPFYEEIFIHNLTPKAPTTSNQNDRKVKELQGHLNNIQKSWSYRIGRFITWLPRKLRGGVRCYQEHGFSYTMDRALIHLHIKPEKPTF